MKKSLLVMLMVLGFALQEPVYERMDEYIRCRDVDVIYEGKYVERVYFVREGLLVKLIEYEYLPFSYYESIGVDIEQGFYDLMDDYVYRGYLGEGYSSLAPYYATDGIINPYRVVDFTEISLSEIDNEVKTTDRKQIVFDLYYKKYEKSVSCSL
ncbi:MAG: hypothetical protein IJ359_07960 [Erysipelotrichaceae bacterium]|nr:hypothetical protein [Erysipelotrichaceae bacterium]